MTNNLTLICDAVECDGYPHANIKINDSIVYSGVIDDCKNKFDIPIPSGAGKHTLSIQRYGKTEKNITSHGEQILKVNSILIDGIVVPKYIIVDNSKFEFNHIVNHGCLDFTPMATGHLAFKHLLSPGAWIKKLPTMPNLATIICCHGVINWVQIKQIS
jgi:hypothetical protein